MSKYAGNIVFLGERLKLDPNPMHKQTFGEYKPYQVKTNSIAIPKSEYPYVNLRFQHLANFAIPHTKFVHPNLKDLDIEAPKVKHETYEVEHLGIKPEMEKGSRPNEVKFQFGMNKKTTVKDFAKENLQEEAGEENDLSRHRDEEKYQGTTTMPFEEQYKQFLRERKEVRQHNEGIDETIKDLRENGHHLPEERKKVIEEVLHRRKRNLEHRRKIRVEPVVPPSPPPQQPQRGARSVSPESLHEEPPQQEPQAKPKPLFKKKHHPRYPIPPPDEDDADMNMSDDDEIGNMPLGKRKLQKNVAEKVDIYNKIGLSERLAGHGVKDKIPREVRYDAKKMGINVPKNARVGWLRVYLAKM